MFSEGKRKFTIAKIAFLLMSLQWLLRNLTMLFFLGKGDKSNKEFSDLTLTSSKVCLCDGGSFCFDASNIFL